MGFEQVLQMILALGVIILLANYLLKKLNTLTRSSSAVIKVIERVPVSKTSSLSIVQINSEYMLMSMTETTNEVLKTFSKEEKEAIQQRLAEKTQAQSLVHKDAYLSKVVGNAKELIKTKLEHKESRNP